VVKMLFVQRKMVLVHVHACKIIMGIRILVVDLNAFLRLIVTVQRHVSILNVLIHVLEVAVLMQIVASYIIHLLVIASPASPVIQLNIVEKFLKVSFQAEPIDPCHPSPCGPNSICQELNGRAVCSCQSGFYGTPPGCRYECSINSDCAMNKACIRNKCTDPCIGVCGDNAICRTINHNPICTCASGYEGDPFIRCSVESKISVLCGRKVENQCMNFIGKPIVHDPVNPCYPSPCGPNSQCRAQNDQAVCTCHQNYIGRAPNCRPECIMNSDCPQNLACINQKCINPCSSCGYNAECQVINHLPMCTCFPGYHGDPFRSCSDLPQSKLTPPHKKKSIFLLKSQ
jgi:hypothetical protein